MNFSFLHHVGVAKNHGKKFRGELSACLPESSVVSIKHLYLLYIYSILSPNSFDVWSQGIVYSRRKSKLSIILSLLLIITFTLM